MSTVCFINVYSSHVDRGATVTNVPIEHYEVDEKDVIVGQRLPKCGSEVMVRAYDGKELTLGTQEIVWDDASMKHVFREKPVTIKVGEEVEVGFSEREVGMGVYNRRYTYVRLLSTEIEYKGGWQFADTILEKLEGPIGQGKVLYPNGDHFKGEFHLSYAHINGPAYAAEGRYTFTDGSYIEKAWINTSEDRKPEFWGLNGMFRIHHPDGRDSIAMFARGGSRYGFELFLPKESWEKPRVCEWYAGNAVIRYSGPGEVFQYEVDNYEIDETSRVDCMTLKLTLRDGDKVYRVEQHGGDYETNKYEDSIYKPSTRAYLQLPNGDSLYYYGGVVRDMQPYDGYVTMHQAATQMVRREEWTNGELEKAEPWERDASAAEHIRLPRPLGEGETDALVWRDGHISYPDGRYYQWEYDGGISNQRPEGHGVLVYKEFDKEKQRYEGEFHKGRAHGKGVFENLEAGIRQEGTFQNGFYQEPDAPAKPVVLHARHGHSSWSVGSSSDWKYEEKDFEARVGERLPFTAFGSYKIARVEAHCVTITEGNCTYQVTPDSGQTFREEIEGSEWSDGCVYDGDDYKLELTWIP